MKRRILSLALCLAMIISLLPQTVLFAQAATSGTCGDNLTWILDNRTLTISGTGAMTDWTSSSSAPWYSSRESIKAVVIEGGVTSIGDYAFFNCKSLTSVTIGNSVTSIGDRAFPHCRSLTSITIPNSVTSIGDWAFYNCYSLTSVTIGNSVMSIGNDAFCYCESLTTVTIPDSVTSIGEDAFYNCSSLTRVTIGNSVTSIGDDAFSNCSSLTNIDVAGNNLNYCDIDGVLFSKDKTNLIRYPEGKTESSYVVPNSVTRIGYLAFYKCDRLTSVTIGNSVTSIGDVAFWYCSSLTSVTIPNSVTSIGNKAFSDCSSLTSVTIPNSVTSIGEDAFWDCSSLTSVTIPNSVTSIGEDAFSYCSSLRSVIIPDSVTSIGDATFYKCTSLASVTIPDSVTSIGDRAFFYCDNLSTVYYGGDEDSWSKIRIGTDNACLTDAEIVYQKSELLDEYKINGITVRNIYGATLNAVPTGICLASVSITNQTYTGDAIVMLASYTADGQYVGLMQAPVEALQVGGTIEVTLPIDNSKGTIAQLKAFVVPSFSNPTPLGAAVTFPAQ